MATGRAAALAGRRLPATLNDKPIQTVQDLAGPGANIAGTRRRHRTQVGDRNETNVFITINTNFKTRDHDLAVAQLRVLREVTRQMLGTPEILKVLDVDPEGPIDFGTRQNLLAPINVKISAEFGTRGSIHTHSVVRITHSTRLFYNRVKIKAFVRDRVNAVAMAMSGGPWFKGRAVPNVKIKLLPNSDYLDRLEKYLNKDADESTDTRPIEGFF